MTGTVSGCGLDLARPRMCRITLTWLITRTLSTSWPSSCAVAASGSISTAPALSMAALDQDPFPITNIGTGCRAITFSMAAIASASLPGANTRMSGFRKRMASTTSSNPH